MDLTKTGNLLKFISNWPLKYNFNARNSFFESTNIGLRCDRIAEQHTDVYTAIKKTINGEWEGVIFTNYVTLNYFNLMEKAWGRIGHTRDVARSFDPSLFFNKHSILRWMFDRKIGMCRESGLTTFWAARYRPKHNEDRQIHLKRLSIQNILAILQITAAMYLIAFMVFLLELFSYEHKRIKKCLDYLTYWIRLRAFYLRAKVYIFIKICAFPCVHCRFFLICRHAQKNNLFPIWIPIIHSQISLASYQYIVIGVITSVSRECKRIYSH